MVYVNVLNSQTTGINKIKNGSELTLYPNPAQNSFTIESTNSVKQTLQVFDVNGTVVLNKSVEGKTNIDASNLSEGVYYLNLISSNTVVNKKLVIVR